MTLLSRFGGLIRDILVMRLFGASALGSAFQAGFQTPNLFRRLFGEGALSAAFIPEYTRLTRTDPAMAQKLATLTVTLLLAATSALMVVIEVALLIVLLVAPPDPERTISLALIMVMLPFMPLICAAAILGGMLQVHGRFGPASSGPLTLNAFIVAVAGFHMATGRAGDLSAAVAIGSATVLSGITQCLWFSRLLRGHVRWPRDFSGVREPAVRMIRKFIPVLIGLGTLQINTFLDTLIAMWPNWVGPTMLGRAYPLDYASNAILASAQRPYQFPLGVFGIAVATAIFPLLARDADDPDRFEQTLRRGLRLSFFIGLPATVGLMLVSTDLIASFFSGGGRGSFTPADVARASWALRGFALAIWAYSLNHVLTRAFYAKGDTVTPMRVSIVMVVINLGLNLTLIWPMREAGLAWATSVSAIIQCVVLVALLGRKLPAPPIDRGVLGGFGGVAVLSVLMGGLVLGVRELMPEPTRYTHHLLRLGACTLVGGLGFIALARAMRLPELPWLLERRPKGTKTVEAAMDS
jgi:putative peptidoglycan lipid II flippase